MKSPFYSNAVQANLFAGAPMPINQPTLWLAIHSEDPTGQDSQAYKEIAGLARAPVPRGVNAWAINGTYWSNVLPINFAVAQGEGVGRYWTLGLAASGGSTWLIGGKLLESVALAPSVLLCIPALMLTSEEI